MLMASSPSLLAVIAMMGSWGCGQGGSGAPQLAPQPRCRAQQYFSGCHRADGLGELPISLHTPN